jgi:hypothetical protein
MIVELEIPDAVYKIYQKHSPGDPEKAILANIRAFAEVSKDDRVLLVGNKDRQDIEVLLERNLVRPSELVAYLREALKVRLDGVEVTANPDLLQLLHAQADFDGRPYKEFAKDRLDQAVSLAIQGY